MSRVLRVKREFLNQREAAEFCGFSESKFREYVLEYDIPRCGPGRNRYKRETLESFMLAPELFYNPIRGRKPGFVPVEV